MSRLQDVEQRFGAAAAQHAAAVAELRCLSSEAAEVGRQWQDATIENMSVPDFALLTARNELLRRAVAAAEAETERAEHAKREAEHDLGGLTRSLQRSRERLERAEAHGDTATVRECETHIGALIGVQGQK